MANNEALVPILRRTITDEIAAALGFKPQSLMRKLLGPLFYPPAQRFSRLIARVDQQVGEDGPQIATQELLMHFVDELRVFGSSNIPADGPLLIASNHPGAYDSIALLSCIPRRDIMVVVSDVPFIHSLPEIDRHMIYTPAGEAARMAAVRKSLRHLNNRGALLIFPSGVVDPDPAVLPGAKEALSSWFASIEIMLKHAPETQLVLAIVSGVLAPSCLRSPVTRLMQVEWRKRKLAEFLQIIQTVLFGRKFGLRPAVSFASPVNANKLLSAVDGEDLHAAIQDLAKRQLDDHTRLAGLASLPE